MSNDADDFCVVQADGTEIPVYRLVCVDEDTEGLEWFISDKGMIYIKFYKELWNGLKFLASSKYRLKEELRDVYDLETKKWVKADRPTFIKTDIVNMSATLF